MLGIDMNSHIIEYSCNDCEIDILKDHRFVFLFCNKVDPFKAYIIRAE